MTTLGKFLGKEKSLQYNEDIRKFRREGKFQGCISSVACEKCYYILNDSTCACAGAYCPNCKEFSSLFKIDIIDTIPAKLSYL